MDSPRLAPSAFNSACGWVSTELSGSHLTAAVTRAPGGYTAEVSTVGLDRDGLGGRCVGAVTIDAELSTSGKTPRRRGIERQPGQGTHPKRPMRCRH